MISENIKIISPLASEDAKEQIIKQIRELNSIKNELADLFEKRLRLGAKYEEGEKKLKSMKGVIFEFVEEEKPKQVHTINKVNIVLKGLPNTAY